MKLREDDNVVLSNTKNETRFTINASAKAFKILSDSLYSRKIEAIVRELSCNAYDSHVQAGCPDRKFEITLPSVWSPEFVVEDFGVGLDADDIENIYTSYFTSTKTDSNDVIGALGLGSKTPFSYTNTFNITSRKNGVEYTYNAYINGSGEPSVSLLSSSPTDKCNGVRISVPVRESDFWQFRTDVIKVISWFHNTPVINNLSDIIDNSNAVRLKELRYFWKHDRYTGDIVTAVMGNVAYVISDVSEKFGAHFNSGELAFISNNRIFIEFDIGDLDVAASRETISFDEHTTEVFVSKLKDVITGYTKDIELKLADIDNVVDAVHYVEDHVGVVWAFGLFEFMGENLNVHRRAIGIENVDAIILEEKGDKRDDQVRKSTAFVRHLKSKSLQQRLIEYVSLNVTTARNMKFVFVENSPEISRNAVVKGMVNELDCTSNAPLIVISVYGKLSDEKIDKLHSMFGEQRIIRKDFIVEQELHKKRLTEARNEARRLKALALASGNVVTETSPRITKTKIRAHVYKVDLSTEFSIKYESLHDDGEFDISLLDGVDKSKVALAPIVRGTIDNTSIAYTLDDGDVHDMLTCARLYNIEYVIAYKAADRKRNERHLGDILTMSSVLHDHTKVDSNFWVDNLVCGEIKNILYSSNMNDGSLLLELVMSHLDSNTASIIDRYRSVDEPVHMRYNYINSYQLKRDLEHISTKMSSAIRYEIQHVITNTLSEVYPLMNKLIEYSFNDADVRHYVDAVNAQIN